MPGPLTGSLGWSGSLPIQLGGPPLISSWTKTIPAQAVPLIAHVYGNDGVTFVKTLGPITNRPSLKATLANGGYEQITVQTPKPVGGVSQGNVLRLTQQGGDGSFIWGGIIEALPDRISSTGTLHEIVASPFGFELDDTYTQLVYTTGVDIADVVRSAVALTAHCFADQVSVPPSTGILIVTTAGAQVDFRNQSVKQVLDTCRSIAGPTWFYHIDVGARVWFQLQGSGSVYTITRRQYEERETDGGSIQALRNQVVGSGGVPTGGSLNITSTYNGTSQSQYGVRSLSPPLNIPTITDQAALNSIVANVGAVVDRLKTSVKLVVREGFGVKIHGGQPGGATFRYWEPAVDALTESGSGTGTFQGPYIVGGIEWDGITQKLDGGDVPVISQQDVDNLVQSLVARAAANSLQVTAAALNLQQQVLTGTYQSAATPAAGPASLWSLGQREFAAIDSNGVTRAEMGHLLANGISPAQWGFRANDANGNPLFDSLGVVGVMSVLGIANETSGVTITSASFTVIGAATVTFTLSRQVKVLAIAIISGALTSWPAGNHQGVGSVMTDGAVGYSPPYFLPYIYAWNNTIGSATMTATLPYVQALGAGSHTIAAALATEASVTWQNSQTAISVFQLGG